MYRFNNLFYYYYLSTELPLLLKSRLATARKGGVPTEPGRNDCTAWKTTVLITQTFQDNIKVKTVWQWGPRKAENVVKGTTESELKISKRRPPPPRGIRGSKERVSELTQMKIRRGD